MSQLILLSKYSVVLIIQINKQFFSQQIVDKEGYFEAKTHMSHTYWFCIQYFTAFY